MDLTVKNLSKQFVDFKLDNISFELPRGSVMGLIGPNGSGKTTTIKLILNMLKKNQGKIEILGYDNIKEEQIAKENLGIVFDSNYFVDEWNMKMVEKAMSRFYKTWNHLRFYSYIEQFKIAKSKKVKELSKGMQMKLMLACAFSYDSKLLILDEPTSGLDPVSRDELLEIIEKYVEDGKHSVLFSTHITSDLEKVADYITYINYGELIYSGEKKKLLEEFYVIRNVREEIPIGIREKLIGVGAFFPWCYQLIFEKDEKENVLYEYKFYRVPLETKAQGSNVDCKDDFYMVKDFLLSMTDNDWKFKQIVIPFDEKKGIYCTLGYEVIFERKK